VLRIVDALHPTPRPRVIGDLEIAVDKPHTLVVRAEDQRTASVLRRRRVAIRAEAHACRLVDGDRDDQVRQRERLGQAHQARPLSLERLGDGAPGECRMGTRSDHRPDVLAQQVVASGEIGDPSAREEAGF
jgi:hypothetical protein